MRGEGLVVRDARRCRAPHHEGLTDLIPRSRQSLRLRHWDTCSEYDSAVSRLNAPELCKIFALEMRGAGKTGCALHPRSRVPRCTSKNAHEHTGSPETPAFPAQWFYGFLRALPGDRALLSPSPVRVLSIIVNLTPASGRQDHTTSPYAAARSSRALPRPPHPIPTFVTMANAPLRDGTAELIVPSLVRGEEETALTTGNAIVMHRFSSRFPVVLPRCGFGSSRLGKPNS